MNNPILGTLPARTLDVLCYGDPVADLVIGVAHPPGLGDKVVGQPLGVWAGGTTANVACALARLGVGAGVYGRVGDDAHARLLRDSFDAFGVDTAFLADQANAVSACAITMVAPSGEKSLVYVPMEPAALDLERLRAAVAQAAIVYAMPYDLDELALLSRLARAAGTLVAIDIEPAVAATREAMLARIALADIVFFNEAGFMAGAGEAPSAASLSALLACGPRLVVVSLGGDGAIAASGGRTARQACFPVDVVDTTGAGDSFNAAVLAAMIDQLNLAQALRFACAAASFTVAALGARSNLPDHEAACLRAA